MTPEEQQQLNQYLVSILEILNQDSQQERFHPSINSPNKDLVVHDISTQDVCVEVVSPPQEDARWYQGLSSQIDQEILQGKIIAYQIRWFNGNWSSWFVPGINDIDHKCNSSNNMRRIWSYFSDHEHKYIICKKPL